MMFKIFEFIMDKFVMPFLAIIFLGLIVGLIFIVASLPELHRREKRLWEQCLKDKKEYECEALLNRYHSSSSNTTVTLTPGVHF